MSIVICNQQLGERIFAYVLDYFTYKFKDVSHVILVNINTFYHPKTGRECWFLSRAEVGLNGMKAKAEDAVAMRL